MHSSIIAGWIFFILGTMAVDANKVEFVSVSNFINCGHFFIHFECCDIPEKNVVILFIPCVAHACKIAFDTLPKFSTNVIMATF